MRAVVITARNPFDPRDRSVRQIRRRARIRALQPRGHQPVIAILNGRPVLRREWRRKLRDRDHLVFVRLPRGGDGSNPLQVILSLALLFFAPQLAPLLVGEVAAGTALIGAFTVGEAVTLGIVAAGQALISAVIPVKKPPKPAQASPTYSLQAQGNLGRIEDPIPVQYGRLLSYPDFAAQPYVEYSGNEQYLFQLLCIGSGEYDIDEIRIEDTPISAFGEVETEIVPPGQQVTLFPTNVVTSVEVSGQDMPRMRTCNWAHSSGTTTIYQVNHGRTVGQLVNLAWVSPPPEETGNTHPGDPAPPPPPPPAPPGTLGPDGDYEIVGIPGPDSFTVTSAAPTGPSDVEIRSIIGGATGFTAAPAGTVTHRLGVDLVLPGGLFHYTSSGKIGDNAVVVRFEIRRIDDAGQPIGNWQVLGAETITDKTVTPIRKTFTYTLATPGRYAFRAWRQNGLARDRGGQENSRMGLAGLRSYLREDEDFGDVTLLAMRMQATNNLSQQSSRKISVLSTRKVPVWNGLTWSAPQPSRSIAWALADAARNAGYGAGLPDRRIDLNSLLALDAVWTARGDRFDGRFDQQSSWWDAAQQILATGRAKPFMQGGQLRIARDAPETVPVAMYSMRNIRRGSFSIDFLMPTEDTADSVRVQYFDETTWSLRKVTATLPGSTADRPADIDLSRGITVRAHALREACYHAASNRYRRRPFKFATEMEGFIPSLGDLIAVSHDMPSWGQHAEAVSWDPVGLWLEVTEPLKFDTSGTHYASLRRRDGSVSGPWPVDPGRHPFEIRFREQPDITPDTGYDRERSHVAFGRGKNWGVHARVLNVRPRSRHEVEIEAVVEDARVHTAEDGQTAPPLRRSRLPRRPVRPAVTGLLARRMPNENLRTMIAWQPAPGADSYQIEMAEGNDPTDPNVSWTRSVETIASHHVITLLYADRTMIRVRAMGLAVGDWTAATIGDLIPEMWNTGATPMWTLDTDLMWSS